MSQPKSIPDDDPERDLRDATFRTALLLSELVAIKRDWKLPLRNGFLAALGGLIATTLTVTLLVQILRPFEEFRLIGPAIKRLAGEGDSGTRR